ncbi:MAG: S-layer homology domain-containing protein [Lachnospiraceae bacterium]|nr:S-layer homology domain-containing protein [Lachnospiraceae bacterium]
MKKRLISCALALVMALSMIITSPVTAEASVYTDVKTDALTEAFVAMESLGAMTASSTSKFGAAKKVNRAQFCNMLVKITGATDTAKTYANKKLFSDVKTTASYAGNVNYCYKMGYIKGKGNGLFKPKDKITYAEAVSSILRVLGYDSSDIGLNYPADDISFAASLDLVSANVKSSKTLNKARVAELLFKALNENTKTGEALYSKMTGVASSKTAIISDSTTTVNDKEKLSALILSDSSASVSSYTALNKISSDAKGLLGTLLLDKDSKVKGFIPLDYEHKDIVIVEGKLSGIVAGDNKTYKIDENAKVIKGDEVSVYGSSGYLEVNEAKGASCRLIYDNDGDIKYVYLFSGSKTAENTYFIEDGNDMAAKVLSRLNLKSGNVNVTKNKKAATLSSAKQFDSFYYDTYTNTICLSDYKLSGYIEHAYPDIKEAKNITVAGCTVDVLESAWPTLADCRIGDLVTLILTDDKMVTGVTKTSTFISDMMGILSSDGTYVTLCDSGLKLSPYELDASDAYKGGLVNIRPTSITEYYCDGINNLYTSSVLNIKEKTYNNHRISDSVSIYEWDGEINNGYVLYSLSGEMGVASTGFKDIYYTDTLPATSVSYYHLNSSDEIDILVLNDVTGNIYTYGALKYELPNQVYVNADGNTNKNLIVVNSADPKGSTTYSYTGSISPDYGGISRTYSSTGTLEASKIVEFSGSNTLEAKNFVRKNGDYYANIGDVTIPVSEKVEIYNSVTKRTYSGEEGLLFAMKSGMTMVCYHDRTYTSGAQVRLIVLKK